MTAQPMGRNVDMTPVRHAWTCPTCKASFEIESPRYLVRLFSQMYCDDCTKSWEAKQRAAYEFTEASRNAARKIASLPKGSMERRKRLLLLQQVLKGKGASIWNRCEFDLMIDVIRKCDLGMDTPITESTKKEKWR